MKKILCIIMMVTAMTACSTDDNDDDRLNLANDTKLNATQAEITFNGLWETDPNANGFFEAGVRMTADSIVISPFPDEQVIIEAFGYGGLQEMQPVCPQPYGMRYVERGYSQSTTIYALDADDYTLTVEDADGLRHTVTVRFAFDCQAAVNNYTGTFILWLKLKAIYVDKEPVHNDRIEGMTFTLTSTDW